MLDTREWICLLLPCLLLVATVADSSTTETSTSSGTVLAPRSEVIYERGDRRDPFVNPFESDGRSVLESRPAGLRGQLVGELRLQGISRVGGEAIAILLGADGIGYLARAGDGLWNGRVANVDFDTETMTFDERVDDPHSPVRFRTVVRALHP